MDHHLTLRPTGKMTSRGERYEVLWGDEVLASSTSPEFKACRVLEALGLEGMAYFWRPGAKAWALRVSIAGGAKKTVMENAKHGPRFVKFTPFKTDEAD